MTTIRRFPGLYCLAVSLALLGATLGCRDCAEHDCGCGEHECDCGESDPGTGGEGGAAGAPSAGGEGGAGGGEVVLKPDEVEFKTFGGDPYP